MEYKFFETPQGLNFDSFVTFVCIDIVSYSRRPREGQSRLVDEFQRIANMALNSSIDKLNNRNGTIYSKEDVLILPTGDGAAIGFIENEKYRKELPLLFSLEFLKRIHKARNDLKNASANCNFTNDGFCACTGHSPFHARIGIDEGICNLIRDKRNGKIHLKCGNSINMSTRMVNLAGKNQIILSPQAHERIEGHRFSQQIDFIHHDSVHIKHGIPLNIYQLTGINMLYLGRGTSEAIIDAQRKKDQTENHFISVDFHEK